MPFVRYQHVERLGTSDTEGILDGKVYVFPKIDGANKSVWLDDGTICCATRNKPEGDGPFVEYIKAHKGICDFLMSHPEYRLYGEWLIPHTLKTYVPDAWRKFYVFDVMKYPDAAALCYVPCDDYQSWMDQYGIEYIPCMATVENGTEEVFINMLDKNTYLVQDGSGAGEGVVLKRYDFVNRYGRTTWAKLVTNSFKFGHFKAMGAPALKDGAVIEEVIVNQYVTRGTVEKEFAKICYEKGAWDSKLIPMLLGCVYHTLVTEELWHALKKFKAHQVIDFRVLQRLCIAKVKEMRSDLF